MKIINSLNRASALLRPEFTAAYSAAETVDRHISLDEIADASQPIISHDRHVHQMQASYSSRATIPRIASFLCFKRRDSNWSRNKQFKSFLISSEQNNNPANALFPKPDNLSVNDMHFSCLQTRAHARIPTHRHLAIFSYAPQPGCARPEKNLRYFQINACRSALQLQRIDVTESFIPISLYIGKGTTRLRKSNLL